MTQSMPAIAGLIELMVWLSPSFPVGSFAYSHGLEWAAGTGQITDRATAQAWLSDLLAHGGPRNDVIILGAARRATVHRDADALVEANDLALALAGSRERLTETSQQGNAFMATARAAWPSDAIVWARDTLTGDVAYPVAVGIAAAGRGLPADTLAAGYLAAVTGSLVSALVRLSVIGQTDGQRILAALAPAMSESAARCPTQTLDDIGGAAFMSDIAAIAHETHDTRLFRS